MIVRPGHLFPGMIIPYAGLTAPRGWLLCDGRTINRTAFPSLSSILPEGVEPGTLVLPDLQGRLIIGRGTGNGLTTRTTGETGGTERHVLLVDEQPTHKHLIQCTSEAGTEATPTETFFAATPINRVNGLPIDTPYHTAADSTSAPDILTSTGSNEGHNNCMPFVALNFIIKL